MTNPNGPGDQPGDREPFPQYPQTNHPEDRPGFGTGASYPGYSGYDGDPHAEGGYGAPRIRRRNRRLGGSVG